MGKECSRDWVQTGKVLSKVGGKYGYERIDQGRLTNDALIAASASRSGITVITANAPDFARLAEFCPLRWEVRQGVGTVVLPVERN